MTREAVARLLRGMEQLREDIDEAESPAEKRRLKKEYGQMMKAIEPYVTGKEPYTETK